MADERAIAAVVVRVETQTSRVMASDGSLAGYYIDADTWREIRAAITARAPALPGDDAARALDISRPALHAALAEVWEDEPSAAEWDLAGLMAERAMEFYAAIAAHAADGAEAGR